MILETWCLASGAKFNIQKTILIPIGTPAHRHSILHTRRLHPSHNPIPPNIKIATDGEPVHALGAFCWRDPWKSMKRSRVLSKQTAMWSEYWTIQRAATTKRVRKMRHIQERQRSTEIGSHIPASVKYLRYVSRPSNRPQSNMLKMFMRKLIGEHIETSDREWDDTHTLQQKKKHYIMWAQYLIGEHVEMSDREQDDTCTPEVRYWWERSKVEGMNDTHFSKRRNAEVREWKRMPYIQVWR